MNLEEKALLDRQVGRAKQLVYLDCRVGGERHNWHECAPDFKPDYGLPSVFQCDRCLCIKRIVQAAQTGEILGESREYPEGYLMKHGEDVPKDEKLISSNAVRVARLKSRKVKDLPTVVPLKKEET